LPETKAGRFKAGKGLGSSMAGWEYEYSNKRFMRFTTKLVELESLKGIEWKSKSTNTRTHMRKPRLVFIV
jgi:hypothetical protein